MSWLLPDPLCVGMSSGARVPVERETLASLRQELERLHPASFDWALTLCGFDRQDAEDLLQSVYLKIVEGKARWDGRSSAKTWLYAVIRLTAADRRRAGWRRLLWLSRWSDDAEPVPAADVELERDQERRRVRTALRILSAKQREVLDLVFFHELTVEDAAAVMGVTVGTARVHYDRAKRRLLEELARP